MQSAAKTVKAYLAELPADRRATIETVRKVILDNLPAGYEEGMQYGMIGYFVPHSLYPPGYHCDPQEPLAFVCLASQKNYLSLYLSCVYDCDGNRPEWFDTAWAKSGKKLDMGKSCIRFRQADDLALEVIAEAIRRFPVETYIAYYEDFLKSARSRKSAATKKTKPPAQGKASPKSSSRPRKSS